jgi:hypothetical protein
MTSIEQNIKQVRDHIENAAQKCDRVPSDITLLAVSKTKPIEAVQSAIDLGQRQFGENYVQEGVEKAQHFAKTEWANDLIWHFIGPLQSNKSRLIAENFQWVHSVDRLKIAKRLSEQRPSHLPPLNVLIQINTSGEASKSGINQDELLQLAKEIDQLPNLILRGLMSIPERAENHESQRRAFQTLADAQARLKTKFPQLDTLSMGMSGDLDAAVEAGSTLVRIGTAIFGARDYSNNAQ